mmetsp:Transcript_42372/g.100552  ORF Transcript_42372/g.100552 Transcript_42372/m.100552 type:complete len:234 (+) Transcript_42372:311-1012(+)
MPPVLASGGAEVPCPGPPTTASEHVRVPVLRHGIGTRLPQVEAEGVVADLQGADPFLVLPQRLLERGELVVLVRDLLQARVLDLDCLLQNGVPTRELCNMRVQGRELLAQGLLLLALYLALKLLKDVCRPGPGIAHVRGSCHLRHNQLHPLICRSERLRLPRPGCGRAPRTCRLLHLFPSLGTTLSFQQLQLAKAFDGCINIFTFIKHACNGLLVHSGEKFSQLLKSREVRQA